MQQHVLVLQLEFMADLFECRVPFLAKGGELPLDVRLLLWCEAEYLGSYRQHAGGVPGDHGHAMAISKSDEAVLGAFEAVNQCGVFLLPSAEAEHAIGSLPLHERAGNADKQPQLRYLGNLGFKTALGNERQWHWNRIQTQRFPNAEKVRAWEPDIVFGFRSGGD